MRHWQRTIEQGNRCFVTGALIDAREHYLHALALAQVLLERWGDADEAVMAFVISHHNPAWAASTPWASTPTASLRVCLN